MNKLTKGNKLAYGLGDTASNLVFQFSLIYLLFFYTDVLGITPAQAGLIFIITRIWDAITNPVMGYIMDHTRSKFGNARVYLRFGPLPLAVATVLMFVVPDLGSTGKFLYALATYVLWSMLYTMVNIPYSSMTAQLSDDPRERTSITSVRMICMLVAVVIVSVATEPVTTAFDNPRLGFLVAGLSYAALAFMLFYLCYYGTRKIALVAPAGDTRYRVKDLWRVLGKNKPALLVAGIFFLGSTAEYIRESSVVYYVSYNMGDSSLVPVFLGIVVLSMIAGNLVMPWFTDRLDKRGTYLAGVGLAGLASVVFQFIPFDNTVLILVVAGISSFGFSVVSTMGWAMLPDTVEYGELRSGVRSEGIIYAFFSFSQKLATAAGGGLVALILSYSGYVAKSPVQSPQALQGILSTLTYFPLGFLVLSAGLAIFYRLDKTYFASIKRDLSLRGER